MKRILIYIVLFCIILFLSRHLNVSKKRILNYTPCLKHLIVETCEDSIKILPVNGIDIDSDAWIMYKKGENYYTKKLLGEDMVMSTSKEIDTTFHNGDFRYICRVIIKKEGQLYSTSIYGTSIHTCLLIKLTYDKQYNIKSINPGIDGRIFKYE